MTDLTIDRPDHAARRVNSPAKLRGKLIGIAGAAALGGFLFGFETAVINGAVDALSGASAGFDLTPIMKGVAVSSSLLGCMIGALLAGRAADRFGRIRTMVFSGVLFALTSVASGLAFSVWDLVLWRVLAGLAIGIASVVVPAYISEIAPAALRGRLASMQQLAITFGIFGAFVADFGFATAAGSPEQPFWFGVSAWRWMLVSGIAPAALYAVLALRLPESPRFLVLAGRDREAMAVLDEVGEPDPRAVADGIRLSLTTGHRPRFADLLSGRPGLFKPVVWVGIALAMFSQTTGINTILYYATSQWTLAGFGGAVALVIPIGTSVLGLLATAIGMSLIDRLGRRPLLLGGAAGMVVGLAGAAGAFATSPDPAQLSHGWAVFALVSAHVFYVFFCSTWGPVVWVMLGEIFPNHLRGAGLSLSAAVVWIGSFVVTLTFPVLTSTAGLSLTYGLYALLTAVAFVFVLVRVPETRGRCLESMNEEARF